MSAQGLAEYLLALLPPDDPERARVLHWPALVHSFADPESPRAGQYEQAALQALGNADYWLFDAMENEILGNRCIDLLTMTACPVRHEKGRWLMAACERLHT